MNILYVCPFSHGINISPPLKIASRIADKNNKVYFYTVKEPYVRFRNKEIELASIPSNVDMYYINNRYLFSNIAYSFINPFREYSELLDIINKNKIDILHFYFPEHLICLPVLVKRYLGNLPIVLSVNALPGYTWFYGSKYVDIIGKIYSRIISLKILEKADIICPSSTQIRDYICSLGLGYKRKIVEIGSYGGNYGLDTQFFKPCDENKKLELRKKYGVPSSAFVIIFAGRFVNVKRLDLLIMAFSQLIKKISDSFLLLVGEGPQKPELYSLAEKNCINNIKFIDFVNQDNLAELYALSDMFALLSSGEGNAMVLLEACSSGLPAIVSNVGAAKDIIKDDINGYVLDDLSINNIVNKIIAIKKQKDKFSVNARKIALENFDWGIIIEKYVKLYESLLKIE